MKGSEGEGGVFSTYEAYMEFFKIDKYYNRSLAIAESFLRNNGRNDIQIEAFRKGCDDMRILISEHSGIIAGKYGVDMSDLLRITNLSSDILSDSPKKVVVDAIYDEDYMKLRTYSQKKDSVRDPNIREVFERIGSRSDMDYVLGTIWLNKWMKAL